MVEIPQSFEEWKNILAKGIGYAQTAGASPEKIADMATSVGNFLADKVDPKNREQRLLKELWDAGSQEERHALASMITKMVGKTTH